MLDRLLNGVLSKIGYEAKIYKTDPQLRVPEVETDDIEIMNTIKPYTMTSFERQWALISAVRYIVDRKIEGDFVECGVWRGGSSMAAALTFLKLGDLSRNLWLYDTFSGMTPPTDDDFKMQNNKPAMEKWERLQTGTTTSKWCEASLQDVRNNLGMTGYPADQVRYVEGPVEHTLADNDNVPDRISILRLDTDWYESTRMEFSVLYPRVATGGVIIMDDYGRWAGAKKAADEYLETLPPMLMHRIDESGRAFVKM